MKLEKIVFQKSYLLFIAFFLFAITGFWFTYFTKILDQENYRMHTHGITLLLWCLMLITQAFLIRAKNYTWHKRIGKLSFVLVPLLIFTTLDLLKYRLEEVDALGNLDYFFIALVVNALLAFAILYGLAIFYKKNSALHARYMVCTVFPMFTPITDRIIYTYFPSIIPHLPTIDAAPIAPVVGFMLADLMLIGLSIWDGLSHKRWNVFPVALAILLLYHYSVLNFYHFEFWKSFCGWFTSL
ncbi:MAG: hypothetical protein JNM57_09810 [Cyclobacteriaceae bacterium]|nr:hypothetical protein [Cyclobacteriaceae bacterium]